MPSKLFQKRKAEAERRAARSSARRSDLRRILMVSEGSKTEPNYLAEFLRLEGLGQIDPYVTRDHNTGPMKLLSQAKQILRNDTDFDLAFVLSDRDNFADFEAALNAAEQIKSNPPIKFIYSDPCFEIWLIFHFEMCDAPITSAEAVQRLRQHIPGYEKGSKEVARTVHSKTDEAIKNSLVALARCKQTGTSCPSTLMHELVLQLRGKPEHQGR